MMKGLFILLLLPAAILAHADMTMRHGDYAVKIIGQGGQIQVFQQPSETPEPTIENKLTLDFDVMNEKTADGSGVGHTDHSYQFTQWQDILYCFTTISETTLPNSNNVPALTFAYNHTLDPHEAQIFIYIYMITGTGQVTLGDEVHDVIPGQVRVIYELNDWEFCNTTKCDGKEGALLDLDLTIKGIGTTQLEPIGDLKWNLGRNGWIQMSKKVVDRGSIVNMAEGYPLQFQHGADHQHFTLRFAKSDNIVYDPIFQAADSSGQAVVASVLSLLCVLMSGHWLSL